MGADGALRQDVLSALRQTPGVTAVALPNGAVEVSKAGQPLRVFPLMTTVSRGLLSDFERWYGTPMSAFYPPLTGTSKKHAI